MERTLDVVYDQLIVGYDLSALCYSYVHKIPLILYKTKDKILDKFQNETTYSKLLYTLSISGLIPYGINLYSARLEDKNLKLTTKNNLLINISFEKIYIFNDENLEGLPLSTGNSSEENIVIDWFDVNSGGTHSFQELKTEDRFVNNIKFYISKRFRADFTKKDCYSISYITNEELKLFEYSQTYSGFKVRKIMKENGIKGRYDKTNKKYKTVKLTSNRRDVFPLGKNIYESNDSLVFIYDDWKDILKQNKKYDEHFNLLEEKFGITY